MSTLDDRIAAAFGSGVKSDNVAVLITEAEASMVSATDAADKARMRALDPALSAKEVVEARRSMEDAAFARDRLQAALPRLQERFKELRAAEEDARRWVAYDKAKAERDKLAEELARVYPPIVEKLAELVTRLAANDKQLEVANRHARPSGAEYVRTAEEVARGLFAFERNDMKKQGDHSRTASAPDQGFKTSKICGCPGPHVCVAAREAGRLSANGWPATGRQCRGSRGATGRSVRRRRA
jgi:hypothetical protein